MRANNIIIEGARLLFRNFSGTPDKYNKFGKRTFSVVLDPALAEKLKAEGWNVKQLVSKDDDMDILYHLPVEARFDQRPPKAYLIGSNKKTSLDEDSVSTLDWVEIENVDIIISPYTWQDDDGADRVKAYLKSIYVTVVEDKFEDKYADIPGDD